MVRTAQTEFEQMAESFRRAKYGSYLIIPLRFSGEDLCRERIARVTTPWTITTADLNETVKDLLNEGTSTTVGSCRRIGSDVLVRELFGEARPESLFVRDGEAALPFSLFDSCLYLFHTQVAFLCLGIRYDTPDVLREICNPGFSSSRDDFFCVDSMGRQTDFSLSEKLKTFCAGLGLESFFGGDAQLLLDIYTYTLAVVPERFRELETMRQVCFNLHSMIPLTTPFVDESEEDVRYVYSVRNQTADSYRWGCCVSSQTISYAVADSELDLESELRAQGEDGLPLVLTALYEKYSCLRFTQLLTGVNKKKSGSLSALKRMMLDFRAYGTVETANISRWHNVKRIYQGIMETNGVADAIGDIHNKVNLLVEHQRELESARSEAVTWILTLFGVVSILDSILSIVQALSGGGRVEWCSAILSTILILVVLGAALLLRKKKD